MHPCTRHVAAQLIVAQSVPDMCSYIVHSFIDLTSPVLQREHRTELVRHERSDSLEVVCSDPSGQQRLVGVAERRVHEQQARMFTDCLCKPFRSLGFQYVAPTARYFGVTFINNNNEIYQELFSNDSSENNLEGGLRPIPDRQCHQEQALD